MCVSVSWHISMLPSNGKPIVLVVWALMETGTLCGFSSPVISQRKKVWSRQRRKHRLVFLLAGFGERACRVNDAPARAAAQHIHTDDTKNSYFYREDH